MKQLTATEIIILIIFFIGLCTITKYSFIGVKWLANYRYAKKIEKNISS